jgi:hypothetical protein
MIGRHGKRGECTVHGLNAKALFVGGHPISVVESDEGTFVVGRGGSKDRSRRGDEEREMKRELHGEERMMDRRSECCIWG